MKKNGGGINYKILMLGDSGVGKSSLINKYVYDSFSDKYNITIGVDFISKSIWINKTTQINIQIWDTAGQEYFRSVIKSFYNNASAVFLVYNITDKETFKNLDQWLQEAKENTEKELVFVLVGNQIDRDSERAVTVEEAKKYMEDKRLNLFFETSAKYGEKVPEAFTETAKLVFLNYIKECMKRQPLLEITNKRISEEEEFNLPPEEDESRKGSFCLKDKGLNQSEPRKKNCC